MSYRDYPDSRLYDDREIYGPAVYDRSAVKRGRSPSPYDREEAYRAWATKRSRSREDYDASGAYGGAASPPRRSWDQLDPEEKEREWARYEREKEWERYRAREYDAEDPYRDREAAYRAEYDDRYRGYADYDRGGAAANAPRSAWAAPPSNAPRAPPMDPMDSATTVSFRRYAQMLRELKTEPCALASGPEATQELYDKYQEYRLAHARKTMKQFWEAHKEDKWFTEKYGITEEQVKKRSARRRIGREGRKQIWLEELRGGKLDKVCLDAREGSSGGLATLSRHGEEEIVDSGEVVNIGPEPNQILIRQIPIEVGRDDLEEALQEEAGFHYLALGEPHPNKKWSRVGWAAFQSEEGLQEAAERLNSKTIAGQKLAFEVTTRSAQAKVKVAPEFASSAKRIASDLEMAKSVVAMLQKEDVEVIWKDEAGADEALQVDVSKEIEQRCQQEGEDGADVEASSKKALDLHIDLLREVYHCDYYSSVLCDFPEELSRRCPKHVRRVGTSREEPQGSEKTWASSLDSKTKLLLRPNDDEIGELGGTALDRFLLDLAAPYSQEDGEDKHRCTVMVKDKECAKPFKAKNFVQKHVLNKHKDFISSIAKEQVNDVKYYNNYVRDPQRVMPSMSGNAKEQLQNGNGAGGASNGHGTIPLGARISQDAVLPPNGGGPGGGGFFGQSGLIRLGGVIPSGAGGGDRGVGAGAGGMHRRGMEESTSLGMRLSSSSKPPQKMLKSEPLPSNPRPLDPRAALAPKRYEDLDAGGGAAETAEIELEY